MFRNALFVKTICGITIYSFLLSTIPSEASTWGLPPESFNKMYSLAQKGDVEALRASVYRGLNIDAVNRSGDTGLCVAAKRRDTYTYNAFRAAGANPRHPCTQRIIGYDNFVERSSAVPMTANSREAYSALGREKYRIAPWVWWTGGALLTGGVILALSLGGGGGGHGGGSSNEKEAYNSLGAYAGTKAVVMRTATQNTTNNQLLRHTNSNTSMISGIDFNYNVLKNAEYLDIVLKADKGATYTNAVDTLLQIGGGTIAMDAMGESKVINDGYIKIDTDNASIGMVASESSSAINNGSGLDSAAQTNGIKMSFSGTEENDTIVGMYADTNSFISNNGEIQGSATLNTEGTATAIAGSMIGMEAMIINEGKDLNTNTINVVNTGSGKIRLTAGDGSAGSEANVAIELVGMGSYLDYYFLNGSQNINRAEQVLLQNYGDIEIDYTGNYTSSSNTALRKGLGGVVGMRADANTNAFNYGNIDIKLNDNGSGEAVDVAAGMQSVHGGKITNNKQISITTSDTNNRANYGMLSVEGSGSVSSLYTRQIPILTNSEDATITMEVSNSYGMASFNSGSLINEGNIILGAEVGTRYTNNIAMFANGIRTPYATLTNNGTIDIYSHKSMAMQNDFGGATPLYNNGIIHVHRDAVDTVVFGGAYSQLINQKDILYGATPNGDLSQTEQSTDVSNPFVNYSPIIGISVMNTKPRTLGNEIASSTSTTERILNDVGANITIYDASFVSGMNVDTAQGIGINKGKITIENRDLEGIDNVTNNVGMYLAADTKDNAYISNSGSIETKTDFAAAMANDSTGNASMLNEKNGTIKSVFKRSIGMYASGRSTLRNGGTIDMQGNENTAVYISGTVDARNESTGVINVGAQSEGEKDNSITTGYGFFTTAGAKANIENKGEINVYTKTRGAGIYTLGQDTIDNMQDINVYTDDTNGIYIGGSANVTNSGTIRVGTAQKGVKNSHAVYVAEGSKDSSVTNSGTIDFYNDTAENAEQGYAIYSEGEADISNTGVVNLYNPKSTAIYANGGTINNNATLNVLHDDSWALEVDDDGDITNGNNGIINVGTVNEPVDNSYGILSDEDSTGTITNNGAINVYNKSDKTYGIYAKGSVNVDNGKFITAFNDDGTAVYATGNNSITNSGEIAALGADSYAVRSNPEQDDQKLTLLNISGGKLILGKSGTNKQGGAAVKAQTIDTVRNNGDILVYNSNAVGIDTQEGTLINNTGNINIYGNGGVGISSGSVNTVKSSGSITLANGTSTDSVGILAQSGSSIETKGSITVNGSVGIGINSGTVKDVTNGATITLNNSSGGSFGIKASNGTSLTNSGNITINNSNGTGIQVSSMSSEVLNSAAISLSANANGSKGIEVTTSGDVTNDADGIITMGSINSSATSNYGIITNSGNITNDGVINMYSGGDAMHSNSTGSTLTNNNNIFLYSGNGYAMYGNSGSTLTNNGSIITVGDSAVAMYTNGSGTFNNNKIINMTGDNNTAMYAANSGIGTFTNSDQITINGNNSYGIRVDETGSVDKITNGGAILLNGTGNYGIYAGSSATKIENKGSITVGNNSYGIWAKDPASVVNSSNITVGDNSHGIHVEVSSYDTKVDIVNSGTITIGDNSVAIYVYKDYSLEPQIVDDEPTGKYYRDGTTITDGGATVEVQGTAPGPWYLPDDQLVNRGSSNSTASVNDVVWFDDDEDNSSLIQVGQGVSTNVNLLNSGTIVSANAVDFGNNGTDSAQNILASGGQYVAESFSGTVHADASIVADGFETTYVNENSFVGKDNGIEVVSDSYMFDASTAVNDEGNTNVVMSLRPFDEIVEDANTSDFLAENYTAQRGKSLFRVFRTASTQNQFDTAVNQGLGRNIVPNFIKQNLDIERTINLEIDDEIATVTDKEYRASFNAVNFNNKVGGKKNLSGYKDNTTAVYGWLDTRAADLRTRGGLGVVLARSNSKFDDGSKRYNNMAEVFAPITYTQNNTIAMLKLKGGAGYGHYRRQGADKWYKGNTEEYYYGADTALKHTIDVGMFEVTPNVGFNLTGMYVDDIDESNGGLKIKGKNMLSAQSALGIDVAKMFNIDEAQSIKLGAGGKYYHEFGDRYHTSATVSDMVGSYDITDERLERDFGLMSLKAKYQYKQFSIEAEANAPLEQKRNPYYLLNLGYKF